MQKRGQVSVFIILGIVLIAAVIFISLLFTSFGDKARQVNNPQEYLRSQLGDIKKVVDSCIKENARATLTQLYDSGGHLNPVRYANYYGKSVTVLCYKIKEDEPCHNMMFTEEDIVNQLKTQLEESIPECIDQRLAPFRSQDYTLGLGEFQMEEPIFSQRDLALDINYPVTLTRGEVQQKHEDYLVSIDTNFLDTMRKISEIINMHSSGREVDLVEISLENIYFQIGRVSTSEGLVYMIKSKFTNHPIFYFAVET